jgi:hypothetical protein
LLGTSKSGATSNNGNTPRIISVYYPNHEQRSQSQVLVNRSSVLGVGSAVNNGGIMRKSLAKPGKGVQLIRQTIKKKVRFTDEVRGNNLTTVYEVESFKNAYSKPPSGDKEKDNENCACKCSIF